MYESDCENFELQFTRNAVIGCGGLRALVTTDPYNSPEANIHKDVVWYRSVLILLIDAWRENHS